MSEQLFIVRRCTLIFPPNWYEGDDEYLSYGALYKPKCDKSNRKNQEQLQWANIHQRDDGEYYPTIPSWRENYVEDKKLERDTYVRIIDNVEVNNLSIEKVAKRSTTQNKLWRIMDPRGFCLEISCENFRTILLERGCVNGILIGSYKWHFGKSGIGKASLIPIN